MTIDEAFQRIIRGHLLLIVISVLVPIAATYFLVHSQPRLWQSSVRIQVAASAPSSSTEAEGMSSRVLALATTPAILADAMRSAGDERGIDSVAEHNVTVQRLGESSVVELGVSSPDRGVATALVRDLGDRVSTFINEGDRSAFRKSLAALDAKIETARSDREELTRTYATLGPNERTAVRVQIEDVNRDLANLTSERTSLSVSDATREHATVIDAGKAAATVRVSSGLIPRLGLAALLGLALGLGLAAAVEAVRPRVPSTRALARTLRAPILGSSSEHPAGLANSMALAARRQGIDTVVLLGTSPGDEQSLETLARQLPSVATYQDRPGEPGGDETAASATPRERVGQVTLHIPGVDERAFSVGSVRFLCLVDVRPWQELTAGIVVVSSGRVRRPQLEHLRDVVAAVRWPVLGVLDGAGAPPPQDRP